MLRKQREAPCPLTLLRDDLCAVLPGRLRDCPAPFSERRFTFCPVTDEDKDVSPPIHNFEADDVELVGTMIEEMSVSLLCGADLAPPSFQGITMW